MGEIAFEDPKFRRRFAVLAASLDERVRVALETRRMIEQSDESGTRHLSWFVCVLGTGHGHLHSGVRPLDEPPGCVSADEKKASARAMIR